MAAEHGSGVSCLWKTLDKVNQQMSLLDGVYIFFRRGDRFKGKLEVTQKNITFGGLWL